MFTRSKKEAKSDNTKSNNLLYVGVIIIIGFSIYFSNQSKNRHEEVIVLHRQLVEKQNELDKLAIGLTSIFRLETDSSNYNRFVENKDLLYDIQTGKKIICYVPSNSCRLCVAKALQRLLLLEEIIGVGHTAIVIGDSSKKDVDYGYDFPQYFIKELNIQEEILEEPILFVINEYLEIQSVFFPELFEESSESYFNETLPSYFK